MGELFFNAYHSPMDIHMEKSAAVTLTTYQGNMDLQSLILMGMKKSNIEDDTHTSDD